MPGGTFRNVGEPPTTFGYERIAGVAQPLEAITVANATDADT